MSSMGMRLMLTAFRSAITTYVGIAYALPATYVFYQENMGGKYHGLRKSFNRNGHYLFFPFYYPREQEEETVRSVMRSDKGSVLVYGKPTTGKSILVKRVCQDIGEGVCRVRPLKRDVFTDRFQHATKFAFEDRFTWKNYVEHISFPLDIFVPPKNCDNVDKFERCLKHFINFVSDNPRKDGHPWVLVIDEADRLDPFEFEMLRQTGDILGRQGLLTIVFVSSQAGFVRLFFDRCGKDESKLLQLGGLTPNESRAFLESPDCQKFVNYFRETRHLPALGDEDIERCLEVCGGSPQWLLQAAMHSPEVWEQRIIQRTEKIIHSIPKLARAIELLCEASDEESVRFETFAQSVGGPNKAFSILEAGRDNVQECSPFFYDVATDTVSFCFPYHRTCATNHLNIAKKWTEC